MKKTERVTKGTVSGDEFYVSNLNLVGSGVQITKDGIKTTAPKNEEEK